MTRIASQSNINPARARAPRATRKRMLKLLDQAVKDQETAPKVELKLKEAFRVELPNGKEVGFLRLATDERMRTDITQFNSVAIDREAGQFYISDSSCSRGPLELPPGFKFETLFKVPHFDPTPKTPGQKVLRSLSKAIREQNVDVFDKPLVNMSWDLPNRTWRTPQGGKLHDVSGREPDFQYGESSFMFDMRKREFWHEQIPGTSGECRGPYKLPNDIKLADVEVLKAEAQAITDAENAQTTDSFHHSTNRRRGRFIGGSDSGRAPRSIGGAGSGSARNIYWSSRGSGGSGS